MRVYYLRCSGAASVAAWFPLGPSCLSQGTCALNFFSRRLRFAPPGARALDRSPRWTSKTQPALERFYFSILVRFRAVGEREDSFLWCVRTRMQQAGVYVKCEVMAAVRMKFTSGVSRPLPAEHACQAFLYFLVILVVIFRWHSSVYQFLARAGVL